MMYSKRTFYSGSVSTGCSETKKYFFSFFQRLSESSKTLASFYMIAHQTRDHPIYEKTLRIVIVSKSKIMILKNGQKE